MLKKKNRFLAILTSALVFFVLVPFLGQAPSLTAEGETLSGFQLKRLLQSKDFVFINVHTPYEGEIGKTDSFIQYDEMMANQQMLPKDKDTPIVLYCKTGRMSAEALKTLKQMGYTDVHHLGGGMEAWKRSGGEVLDLSGLPKQVLPAEGFTLPVSWGDIGPRLVELGVIDAKKFEELVSMTDEEKKIFKEGGDYPIKIGPQNGQFVVDLLWALGLAQKSIVYDEGPLGKEYKDKQGNFASTGGWSLAKGDAVDYLNKFDLISLTPEQHKRVGEIAKNVYRPCCGNPTWFPDCNHGMAALAAIELLVSKGLSDEEIYKEVLKLNSFWFPDNYLMVATYFARQGTPWDKIDAKEVLGVKYSSAQGAGELYQKVGPLPYASGAGGSCGA
ncbi:MAG: rhodanese-like domain-containing protein [Patescibacteria group bacterium]